MNNENQKPDDRLSVKQEEKIHVVPMPHGEYEVPRIVQKDSEIASLRSQLKESEQALKDEIQTNENLSLVCNDLRAHNSRLVEAIRKVISMLDDRGDISGGVLCAYAVEDLKSALSSPATPEPEEKIFKPEDESTRPDEMEPEEKPER